MMDAIVLDGEQRSALAVTRSLGRKGVRVIVGAEKDPSLSSCSRYCTRSFLYPSPYHDPVGFIQALRDSIKETSNSILFPITDVTLTEILLNRKELPENMVIPFEDFDKYIQVTDKIKLFQLGRDLKVPIPTSYISTEFENHGDLIESVGKSGFPVVIKSSFSKIRTGKGWIDTKIHYAMDEMELRKILLKDIFQCYPFLVQKRIDGPGVGIFLLMKNGEIVAEFSHKRIREKPPSGGVSVLCESIEMPTDAMQTAVKILEKLRWTGVAMVEFKIDQEGNVAKLIEVNARFWGSLELAISCGVDFPFLLFRLASGENISRSNGYTIGLKSRWELGDLDHLFIRLFRSSSNLNLRSYHASRISLVKDFLFDFFRPSVKNEIMQLHDMKPFFQELKGYVKYIIH